MKREPPRRPRRPAGDGPARTAPTRAEPAGTAPARTAPARITPSRIAPAVVLGLAVLAAWLAVFPGSPDRPTRVWRGYETLLVRGEAARDGRLGRLVTAMGPGVVSELTAPVTFWDFTGVASVPLARLDERIDPRDPRHDPVMDALPGYFHAPTGGPVPWQVVYVPARRPAPVDYLRITAVLGPAARGWRLVEFDPLQVLVSLVGISALALLLVWPRRREGRLALALVGAEVFLWVPYLLGGGLARLALALLLLSSWYRAADVLIALHGWDETRLREVRGPLAVFLAQAGAGFVALLPAGGFCAGEIVALCGPVAGSCLLLLAGSLYEGRAVPRLRRRRTFEPVPIVRPAALAAPPGQAAFLLALAALLLSAVIPLVRSVPVASPVGVIGARDFSWESLQRLSRTSVAARLPDASDLVTHEAWEETLAFGRPWGMPRRDERVYMRGFLIGPDPSIVAAPRRVKVFDSTWLRARFADPPSGSLERLLVAQGRATAVGLRGDARELFREAPVALLVMFVLSALLVRDRAPVGGRRRILVPLMKSVVVRLNGAARRNQIP